MGHFVGKLPSDHLLLQNCKKNNKNLAVHAIYLWVKISLGTANNLSSLCLVVVWGYCYKIPYQPPP